MNPTLLMTAKTAAKVEAEGNDLGDVCQLLSRHRRGERLPRKYEFIAKARHAMRENRSIRAIQGVVWCGDDSVELLKAGCRGGLKRIRIWNHEGVPV